MFSSVPEAAFIDMFLQLTLWLVLIPKLRER